MGKIYLEVQISKHPDAYSQLKALVYAAGGTCRMAAEEYNAHRSYDLVIIEYDEFTIRKKSTRLAGAHKKKIPKEISYGSLKQMLKSKTQKEAAEELGYSIATFKRRLSQAKKEGWPDWKIIH